MKGITYALAAAAAAAVAGGLGAGASEASPAEARATGAESPAACRTVVKKVRGKRRRVRVCPRPAPARDVRLRLDGARAASAAMGPAGGTITVASASGATLTLVVPAGAFDAETQVVATPVASLGGVPAGATRVLGAVQFEPDGLALAKPATLTVELPSSPRSVTGFAWFGQGETAHRYPFARSGSRLSLRITHFSGAGVVDGQPAWLTTAATALTTYFARELRPLMRAAETDDTQFLRALDAALGWERHVEVAGLGERFAAWKREIGEWLRRALANAVEKASAKCASHDLTQLVRLLQLERLVENVRVSVPGESPLERYLKCARFELDTHLRAAFELVGGGPVTQSGELTVRAAAVVLTASSHPLFPEGAGPLDVVSWQLSHSFVVPDVMTCTGGAGAATPMDDLQAGLELYVAASNPRGFELALRIEPGSVQTSASVTCTPGGSRPEQSVFDLNGVWRHAFADLLGPDGRLFVPLQAPAGPPGGEIVATYGPETRSVEFGSATFKYVTTLTWSSVLRHAPAP